MDEKQIKETKTWELYEKGRNYLRMENTYVDTDRNYKFYNGNQWDQAKLGDVEPVQKNFIKPIVKYKIGVIHDNLYAVNFSSENFELKDFREEANKVCEMLNKKAAKIWENDKLDFKGRTITKDAAINDEGIMYVTYDKKNQTPLNEIIKKNDIYYGNENEDNIQKQPYIIVRKRMPLNEAQEFARQMGLSKKKIELIVTDKDTQDESGESAKQEVNDNVTILTKMYKVDGLVHYSIAARYVDIVEDENTKLHYYPIAHFNWEAKEGSARGEGEVRYLIPNQIEVNRTEMRRVLTVKLQAYPQKVANIEKIINPDAINKTGGVIKVKGGATVDDVDKIIRTLHPAQMSPDVRQLQEDLINVTRDLAGAGDIATGSINPEDASGKAILAVQQASQSPMTEQKESYKNFIEDLAKIWLDMIIVYSVDGINLEFTEKDKNTGEEITTIRKINQVTLENLKASVKIDVTPKGVYDKYAQEISIENMFKAGMFNIQKLQELKVYVELLDDDSVMPKQKLLEAIKLEEEEQQKIALINANAQIMQQNASQFLNGDVSSQSEQLISAEEQL